MAGLQIQGAGGSVVEAGAFAAKGLHGIAKPQDYGAFGHYRAVLTTGTIAAGMAAGGELVQMRWVDATRFCLIYEVEVLQFANITTAFAAGPYNFTVHRSTAWSADGTGGGVVSVADPQLQLRAAAMGASLFSTGFRLATTAALGAGTKTFDTLPMGACYGNVGSTPAIAQMYIPGGGSPVTGYGGRGVELLHPDIASGEHPMVLTSNGGSTSEGISIRGTVPATGTWIASFLVKWAEVAAF
jgi:hypothetical protein